MSFATVRPEAGAKKFARGPDVAGAGTGQYRRGVEHVAAFENLAGTFLTLELRRQRCFDLVQGSRLARTASGWFRSIIASMRARKKSAVSILESLRNHAQLTLNSREIDRKIQAGKPAFMRAAEVLQGRPYRLVNGQRSTWTDTRRVRGASGNR